MYGMVWLWYVRIDSQHYVCLLNINKVRKRPLSIWKRLLEIIGIQKVCHVGEPDYENNFNAKVLKTKCGPEPESIVYNRQSLVMIIYCMCVCMYVCMYCTFVFS